MNIQRNIEKMVSFRVKNWLAVATPLNGETVKTMTLWNAVSSGEHARINGQVLTELERSLR